MQITTVRVRKVHNHRNVPLYVRRRRSSGEIGGNRGKWAPRGAPRSWRTSLKRNGPSSRCGTIGARLSYIPFQLLLSGLDRTVSMNAALIEIPIEYGESNATAVLQSSLQGNVQLWLRLYSLFHLTLCFTTFFDVARPKERKTGLFDASWIIQTAQPRSGRRIIFPSCGNTFQWFQRANRLQRKFLLIFIQKVPYFFSKYNIFFYVL